MLIDKSLFHIYLQLETKFRQEMEEHKQKLDKEYEQLMQNFIKELDKFRMKHQQELDKTVRAFPLNSTYSILCYEIAPDKGRLYSIYYSFM